MRVCSILYRRRTYPFRKREHQSVILYSRGRLDARGDIDDVRRELAHCVSYIFGVESAGENDLRTAPQTADLLAASSPVEGHAGPACATGHSRIQEHRVGDSCDVIDVWRQHR